MTTRSPHSRRRRRIRGEKGYILAMTGLLIVPLVIFTAFGVDLGAWYAQSAKQQRAVDAASLAGVVQLPTQSSAIAAALDSLNANGYNCNGAGLVQGTTPTSSQPCMYQFPQAAGQEMQIFLYANATQYFSSIVLKGESLTRTATAVYNLHIPLASPSNFFGNNMSGANGSPACTDPEATCAGSQPQVWGAINGPYSNHADGDPYSGLCAGNNGGTDTSCATTDSYGNSVTNPNPLYNQGGYNGSGGYVWVVNVPASDAGSTVTIQVYDPSQSTNGNYGEGLTPGTKTGCTTTTTPSCGKGFTTSFGVFNTTGSNAAYDLSSGNAMTCTTGPGYQKFPAGQDATPGTSPIVYYTDMWYTLCKFTVPTGGGSFPIQVKSSNISGVTNSGGGWNVYSLRAPTTGATPTSVYAVNDMSIWTNPPATNGTAVISKFYLANITNQYAGHTLVIDMYDPGDGSCNATGSGTTYPGNQPVTTTNCNFTMSILKPPAGAPTNPPSATPASNSIGCSYNSVGSATYPATNLDVNSASSCNITTRDINNSPVNKYNERWMRVQIQIPPAAQYTCTTDCWWTVYYNFGNFGAPTDRTVWVVNVLGDPVHLIN
jgi:hypothetical protein